MCKKQLYGIQKNDVIDILPHVNGWLVRVSNGSFLIHTAHIHDEIIQVFDAEGTNTLRGGKKGVPCLKETLIIALRSVQTCIDMLQEQTS